MGRWLGGAARRVGGDEGGPAHPDLALGHQPPGGVDLAPVHHRLVVTSSRSRGGRAHGVRWFHDEYDGTGALVSNTGGSNSMAVPAVIAGRSVSAPWVSHRAGRRSALRSRS
jgi:hypothetical protein